MAQTREQPSVVHPAGSLDRACETSVSGTNLHEGQTSPHQEPCTKLRAEPVSTGAIATSTFQSLSIKNAELTLARHCQAPLRAPFPGTPFRAPLRAPGSVVNGNETRFEASHTFHCFAAGTALRL